MKEREWNISSKDVVKNRKRIFANDWYVSIRCHPIGTLLFSTRIFLSAWNQLYIFYFLPNLLFSAIIEVNALFIYNDSYSGTFK